MIVTSTIEGEGGKKTRVRGEKKYSVNRLVYSRDMYT